MDKLVSQYDLRSIRTNQDVCIDLRKSMEKEYQNTQVNMASVMAVFRALETQIAHEDYLIETDDATYIVADAISWVVWVVENKVSEECSNEEGSLLIGEKMFDLIVISLESKTTSGHLKLILYSLMFHDLYTKYAKKRLTGEKAKRLVKAIEQTFEPKLFEDNKAWYLGRIQDFYREVFQKMDPEQRLHAEIADAVAQLLKYSHTTSNQHPDEKIAKSMARLPRAIGDYFYKKEGKHKRIQVYQMVSSADTIKDHLECVTQLCLASDFPKYDYSERQYEDWIMMFIVPALKYHKEHSLATVEQLMKIMWKLVQHNNEKTYLIGQEIVYFFRDYGDFWKDPPPLAPVDCLLDNFPTTLRRLKERKAPFTKDKYKYFLNYCRSFLIDHIKSSNKCEKLFDIILASMDTLEYTVVESLEDLIKIIPKRKLFKWETHADLVIEYFKKIGPCVEAVNEDETDAYRYTRTLHEIGCTILDQMKAQRSIQLVNTALIDLIENTVKDPTENKSMCAYEFCEYIDWKDALDRSGPVVNSLSENLSKIDWEDEEKGREGRAFILALMSSVVDGTSETTTAEKLIAPMKKILDALKGDPFLDLESGNTSPRGRVVVHVLNFVAKNPSEAMSKGFIDTCLELSKKCDDDDIKTQLHHYVIPSFDGPNFLASYLDQYFELLLEDKVYSIYNKLQTLIPLNKDTTEKKLGDLVNALSSSDETYTNMVAMILQTVADNFPMCFQEKHIKPIADSLDQASNWISLRSLAASNPGVMIPYLQTMINKTPAANMGNLADVFGTIGVKNEEYGRTCMDLLCGHITKVPLAQQVFLLSGISKIGHVFPALLNPKLKLMKSLAVQNDLKQMADQLIDIIEGRTIANISEEVKDQREDIDELQDKTEETDKRVNAAEVVIAKQVRELDHVKEDVTKAEEKLDNLEEVVEDTVDKVDDLDKKTMTNAPAWSRDVTKLMNPDAEQDWRLFAQRLGYSNKDIKAWATQHDPCMAVLSEWYATHKTSEATHAVLKALQEINRLDAAEIVQAAIDSSDNVVEDPPEDIGPLPPVFLSYQWGHQQEAKLLKKHLEGAGYKCWMDLGQMGGGDKLFAKIDAGIRAASIVICLVTEKYAQSDNCNREVNLCVNLGKPIIPLLMEKMSWPPAGAMGPIFGEYLFIRFFARPHEMVIDGLFWPDAKFMELLGQLRYTIAPEEAELMDEYRDWWKPKEEDIVIKPKDQNKDSNKQQTQDDTQGDVEPESPSVFLSYQWGKQTQIKALYSRLSRLGFSCWMDIFQMGGGDSLYDKIDRGVRNCKVVVACVTGKYSQSANCRREVSLSDALKKPIVPLLLDDMTWPPAGPMSMVFTQLLYINCKKNPETQVTWDDQCFRELVEKIKLHVPDEEIDASLLPALAVQETPQVTESKRPESSLTVATSDNRRESVAPRSRSPSVESIKLASSKENKTGNDVVKESPPSLPPSKSPEADDKLNGRSIQAANQKPNESKVSRSPSIETLTLDEPKQSKPPEKKKSSTCIIL